MPCPDGPAPAPATGCSTVKQNVTHPRDLLRSHGPGERRRADLEKEMQMTLFMDAHTIEGGVSASDVAQAHKADRAIQAGFGVDYQRYWVDEAAGKIFCLVDAPDAETAITVHRLAHGLTADEVFAVA